MKYGLLLAGLLLFSVLANLLPQAEESRRIPSGARIPVVVELFTSEGCSSCPPADALLAKLDESQPVSGAEIIALEEHVDYWDSLGWKDPYSSSEWTRRQQQYSEVFRSGSIYTPQMVVDGQTEFVGSRGWQAEKEVLKASRAAKTELTLTPTRPSNEGTLLFTIRVGRMATAAGGEAADVWLAVTESKLQSSVTEGENAGEHLHHTSVLRTLKKVGKAEPDKDQAFVGEQSVRLDSAWKRENIRVIAILQERKSRKILGAASAVVTP